MERIYYIRKRRITVEELPDVLAIRVDGSQPADRFGTWADDAVIKAGRREIARDDLAAFRGANWLFVRRTDELLRKLEAREQVRGVDDAGKVMIDGGGSIVVVPNRLNVKLRPELATAACDEILRKYSLKPLAELRFSRNLFQVECEGPEDAMALSVKFHDNDEFVFAEPSLLEHVAQRYVPDDPEYPRQWHWNNTGQTGGTPGADVHAEAAWDITRGAGIRVAVIDRGFQVAHPDLAAGISAASGSYSSSGAFQQGTAAIPTDNHGTWCAGMVGARENKMGGVGGAFECELLLVATASAVVEQARLASAIGYAIDPANEGGNTADRADVLSCSLGKEKWTLSATLDDVLNQVDSGRDGLGMPIFWAASNHDVDSAEDEVLSHNNVIAVVTSDHQDLKKGGFLGPGAHGASIELIAPGTNVDTTDPASPTGYGIYAGTSLATPCAAACAALVLAANNLLTREDVRQILRDTADKIGNRPYDANGHNDYYGFGRVNAHAAVVKAQQAPQAPPAPVRTGRGTT